MKKYTGAEGAAIDLKDAARWTARYRNGITNPETARAHMFGNNIIDQLLDQPGCVGMRMYYALNDEGVKQLILVGVDAEGNDMEDGVVVDGSRICPPDCAGGNLLSSGSIARKL